MAKDTLIAGGAPAAIRLDFDRGMTLTLGPAVPGLPPGSVGFISVKCEHGPDHLVCPLTASDAHAIVDVLALATGRKVG